MMLAHEQNLSFNEFVEQALKEKIEELNNE